MPKYLITRKRIVIQSASFEIEVEADANPLEAGDGVPAGQISWEDGEISSLSTDVAPVIEDEPEDLTE